MNRAVERKSSNGFNIEKKYLKRKKQKLKIKKERLMNLITIFINLVMIKRIINFYLVVNRKGKLIPFFFQHTENLLLAPTKKNPRHVIFLPPP